MTTRVLDLRPILDRADATRAAQYKHSDIETAVAHLHGMLDEMMQARR
jgi:hypothetical protein